MKKTIIFKIPLFAVFFLALSVSCAQAYWIWTPKTGKFVNPKTEVRKTPAEQFSFAKSLFDSSAYDDAKKEFKKLLKNYPKAAEAAEAQYYIGLIEEAQGNLYGAFLAFQKVIDKYPFSERISQIVEKQYNIGEEFMAGKKRKSMGVELPVDHPSIEIFTKVVENSVFGPLAPKAQYKLGLVLKTLNRYYEAEDAFNRVVSSYPQSEWIVPAQYQIASCRALISKSAEYDQAAIKEAKQKFETFLQDHPDAVLASDAEKNIQKLREQESEAAFHTALFYEKQKDYKAAIIYLDEVINKYQDTAWAVRAMERREIIERKMAR